jgi:hypothetical protein
MMQNFSGKTSWKVPTRRVEMGMRDNIKIDLILTL